MWVTDTFSDYKINKNSFATSHSTEMNTVCATVADSPPQYVRSIGLCFSQADDR